MSLNPTWIPEDEDRKRRAEIEAMMRSERERYFRDEDVQQEYRDIVGRLDAPQADAEVERPAARSERFDVALAQFRSRGETEELAKPMAERVAQNATPSGTSRPEHPAALFATDGVNRVDQMQSTAKIRKGLLSFELEDQLNYAAYKTGLRAEVKSGGQPAYGRYNIDWTGSDRHDDGGAGDVKLLEVVNGKKRYLNSANDADRRKMQDFIRYSVIAGATGIGHGYMGPETTHIGGGSVQAWQGIKAGSPPAFLWVQSAFDSGRAERQSLMKSGWNGLVDTMAKGRPLSLSPPKPDHADPLTRKQREEKFLPRKNMLPPLY